MPPEPKNNDQQSSATPHFDAFSGHDKSVQPSPEPIISESSFNPVTTASTPTPTPMSTIDPLPPIVPTSESILDQSTAQTTKPSGFSKFLKNKKLVIGVIVAILIVVVGGGSTYAYVSYFQNPQKVITDSLVNAFTAKTSIYTGTIISDSSGVKVTVDITTKTNSLTGSFDAKVTVVANGKTYIVNGSALYDQSGNIYFKVQNLADIIAEAKSGMAILPSSPISVAVDKIVAKIDGVWVKISSDDVKQFSAETASSQTCINDTIKKFKDDKVAITELADVYSKNQFIVVEKDLGQKDGSLGYQIKSNNTVAKTFAEGLKGTKVYKSLNDCDKTFVVDTSTMNIADDLTGGGTINLWVNMWSHQITKIELNSNSDGSKLSATILPKYNQSVTISPPSETISLAQLQTYIDELTSSFSESNNLLLR
jgi:hypothetical protein